MGIRNIATIATASFAEFGEQGKLLGTNSEGKAKNLPLNEILQILSTIVNAMADDKSYAAKANRDLVDDGGNNTTKTKNVNAEAYATYSVGNFYRVDDDKQDVYKCTAKTHSGDSYVVTFERQTGLAQALNVVVKDISDGIENLIDNGDDWEDEVILSGYDNYTKYTKGYFYKFYGGLWLCTDRTRSGSVYRVTLSKMNGIATALNRLVDLIGN